VDSKETPAAPFGHQARGGVDLRQADFETTQKRLAHVDVWEDPLCAAMIPSSPTFATFVAGPIGERHRSSTWHPRRGETASRWGSSAGMRCACVRGRTFGRKSRLDPLHAEKP